MIKLHLVRIPSFRVHSLQGGTEPGGQTPLRDRRRQGADVELTGTYSLTTSVWFALRAASECAKRLSCRFVTACPVKGFDLQAVGVELRN